MSEIRTAALPKGCLLEKYAEMDSCYTDCFKIQIRHSVNLEEFVTAFFTSKTFYLERGILALVGKRSSTQQLEALTKGTGDKFAAWHVEQRTENELLLTVRQTPIRSWFMVSPQAERTMLYFGSAVLPTIDAATNAAKPNSMMQFITAAHRLYSKILLWSAIRNLQSS